MGHIQITCSIVSNLAQIKAHNFQHEYVLYVFTSNISNHTKSNYYFGDMDPLSLILE